MDDIILLLLHIEILIFVPGKSDYGLHLSQLWLVTIGDVADRFVMVQTPPILGFLPIRFECSVMWCGVVLSGVVLCCAVIWCGVVLGCGASCVV